MYYVVLAIFLAAFLLIYRIIHSPFGQVLKAIRENEPRAISLGYDADRYKLLAFVLSATLAGLAGATKAIVFQLASLTDVHWTMSGEVVLMTLLGGMGTIFGPVVGAFAIIGLENYLAGFGQWVTVITGVIFVVCVLAFRRGIVGELGAWWASAGAERRSGRGRGGSARRPAPCATAERGGTMKSIKRRDVAEDRCRRSWPGARRAVRRRRRRRGRSGAVRRWPRTFIPIAGSAEQFPVRRIYCIGRNYAAHAREMGSDPTREPPFFFQKPTDAIQIVPPGETVDHPYPTLTKNYHYEVELVAALGQGRARRPGGAAPSTCVFGYTVGLDMTRRDLQRAMGDEKKPWEIGKSFDHSAVLGPLQPVAKTGPLHRGRDLAQGQRAGEAERQPEPDDLERRRADQQPLQGLRADAGRHHLQRHARERRARGQGRRHGRAHRRAAGHPRQGRLSRPLRNPSPTEAIDMRISALRRALAVASPPPRSRRSRSSSPAPARN